MPIDPNRHRVIASLIAACNAFEWDEGNRYKNWISHGVRENEAEEVFVNSPLLFFDDPIHSVIEARYAALGRSKGNRLLAVVFTIRPGKIRVISARPMSRKDRLTYEEQS